MCDIKINTYINSVFTRDSIYAIARLCDSDVSVCLSVTRQYCA